jgi:hypothetical protein
MTSGEINMDAAREVYTLKSIGGASLKTDYY